MVAGEDVRFALKTDDPEWLMSLLPGFDGTRTVEELLAQVPKPHRAEASALVEQLLGERVLVAAGVGETPLTEPLETIVIGSGSLAERLRASQNGTSGEGGISILCQQTLDYFEVGRFNLEALAAKRRWIWVTTGPTNRAYVSPLFLPDAGPCAGCLLDNFQRLSPAPGFYEMLLEHGRAQQSFAVAEFPEAGLNLVADLVRWKLQLTRNSAAPSALFSLHVVEAGSLAVTSHPVFAEPSCKACRF